MAAARMTVLSVEQLADRLDDRFRVLTRGGPMALSRHQTLWASVDWSYDLLNEAEQVLFRHLAVFAGSFTLQAAEAVCSEVNLLDPLQQLVEKSLVVAEPSETEGWRFRLLETLRAYARERLDESGETETLREVHAAYYLRLAEEANSHFDALDRSIWIERLAVVIANLRAAFAYFFALSDTAGSLRLATSLVIRSYDVGNLAENSALFAAALALPHAAVDAPILAPPRLAAAGLAWVQTDYPASEAHSLEALLLYRALGDLNDTARVLCHLGITRNHLGDYVGVQEAYEEALAIQRELANPDQLALALAYCGDGATGRGEVIAARNFLAEGLVLARSLEIPAFIAWQLWNQGRLALLSDDWPAAAAAFAEAYAIGQRHAAVSLVTDAAHGLGTWLVVAATWKRPGVGSPKS
jgi:tetratricopeptide (TPR) repeat protein